MANQTVTLAFIAETEAARRRVKRLEDSVDDLGDEMRGMDSRKFNREMDKASGRSKRLDRGLSGVIRRMLTLKFLMKTLKFTAIYTGIRLLLPLVSSLGAATFALVSSMGAFAGLVGAIPAAFGAAISTFGALKFATAGLGDSLKVLMSEEADPEELAKAIKKAGPEAVRFAGIMKALRRETEADRMTARNTIFAQLNLGLERLRDSGAMQMVIDHFGRMATVIGGVIDTFSRMLSSGGVLRSLDTILRGNERTVGKFGQILSMLAEVMIHVTAAAQPLIERILVIMDTRVRSLLDRVREGVRDGSLQRFFLRGLEAAQRFGAFLGMMYRALRNINDVLNESNLRERFIQPFEEGAAAFEKYTASVEGQADILRWFEQSARVMESFYGFLGRVMNILRDLGGEGEAADALVYFLDELSAAEGPLDRLFTALGSFDLMKLVDTFIDIFDALASLVGLLPTLEILVDLLGYFARGAKTVFDWISNLPEPVKDFLGALLAIKVAFVALQTVWLAIVGANVLARIAQGLLAIRNLFLAIKSGSLVAIGAAMPWLVVIALLIAGIYTLWKNSETFRNIVTGAFEAVLSAAQNTWNWIRDNWRLLVAMLGPIGWTINHIVNNFDLLKAAAMAVWGWIRDNWRLLVPIISPFLAVVVAIVQNFNTIKTAVIDAMDTVKQKFADAVEFINGLPGAGLVISGIQSIAGTVSEAGRFGGVIARGVGRGAAAVTGVSGGDTSAQRGSQRGNSGLAATLAMHRMVDRMTPGSRTITNATRGKWGGSEHHRGRALDLTGSFMGAYSRNLAAVGGGSERHAQGSSPHTHAVFPVAPAAASSGGGGGPSGDTLRNLLRDGGGGGGAGITIEGPLIGQVVAREEMDVERAAYRALERIVRERRERG